MAIKNIYKLETMAEVKAKVDELIELQNKCIDEKLPQVEEVTINDKKMTVAIGILLKDLVADYDALSKDKTFRQIEDTEDPMKTAIEMMKYPIIKIKEVKNDNGEVMSVYYDPDQKFFDLVDLEDHRNARSGNKDGIGRNPLWRYELERLNKSMTLRATHSVIENADVRREIVGTINNKYAISSNGAAIDFGEEGRKLESADATSKTQLKKLLNQCIADMLGEGYNATSKDVNTLIDTYATWGKSDLGIACPNHRKFRRNIMRIMHKIVTKSEYDMEFEVLKG